MLSKLLSRGCQKFFESISKAFSFKRRKERKKLLLFNVSQQIHEVKPWGDQCQERMGKNGIRT